MSKDITFKGNSNKKILFTNLLDVKINTVVIKSKEWLNNHTKRSKKFKNLKKMDKLELRGEMKQLVNDIVEEYEKLIPERYFKIIEDRTTANEAFKLIYYGTKESRGFKKYHERNLKPIIKYIDNIPLYTTSKNDQVVYHVLGLFDTALLTAIQDLKESCDIINGQIKQLWS